MEQTKTQTLLKTILRAAASDPAGGAAQRVLLRRKSYEKKRQFPGGLCLTGVVY